MLEEIELNGTYIHTDSQKAYRVILEAFNVKDQKSHIVYMQLKTGQVFSREKQDFQEKFKLHIADTQMTIQPKEK